MEDLFVQLVNLLFNLEEVLFHTLFVDETKIEANANRYSFVWLRAVSKCQVKMYSKIKSFLPVYENRYGVLTCGEKTPMIERLRLMFDVLNALASQENLVWVQEKGNEKNNFNGISSKSRTG